MGIAVRLFLERVVIFVCLRKQDAEQRVLQESDHIAVVAVHAFLQVQCTPNKMIAQY